MRLGELYKEFVLELESIYDQAESENISDWVFEKILGLKRGQRHLQSGLEIAANVGVEINSILQRLLLHEPVQYVLNESYFYKDKFYVDSNVLIPRPETEELVDWIIKEYKGMHGLKILDVGCGSGCIAISLQKYFPGNEILAIDVSEKALEVAERNAKNLNSEITLMQSNFLEEKEWNKIGEFDILVSNPPYIPFSNEKTMRKNVTEYEPHVALFVENNNPNIFYEKLASFSRDHLKHGGKLFVETHEEHAIDVKNIFAKSGLINCEIRKDIFGKERMVSGTK